MTRVTLYTRPGCHLCDEARARLEELRGGGRGFELAEVNIEEDERLHARYLERIPVVEIGGRIVSELVLDEGAVRSELDTVAA
ncbi:MAG: glutaredoxin family protein [Solirubrobacterales bacterium]